MENTIRCYVCDKRFYGDKTALRTMYCEDDRGEMVSDGNGHEYMPIVRSGMAIYVPLLTPPELISYDADSNKSSIAEEEKMESLAQLL